MQRAPTGSENKYSLRNRSIVHPSSDDRTQSINIHNIDAFPPCL